MILLNMLFNTSYSHAAINLYGMKTAGPNIVKCRELCQSQIIKCQHDVEEPGYIDWCAQNCLKNSQIDQGILNNAIKACQTINQHTYSATVSNMVKDQIFVFEIVDSKVPSHQPGTKVCIQYHDLYKELGQINISKLKNGSRVVFDTLVDSPSTTPQYRLCPTRLVVTGKILPLN